MSLEDNKTIARRYVEESVMQGNMDVLDTFFAPHLTVHFYGTPTHNHASFRSLIEQVQHAFSGYTTTIDDLIAEGDTVAMRISFAAKAHQSHLGKNPPTGQPVQVESTYFFHFEQGKVVEIWILLQGVDFDFSPA